MSNLHNTLRHILDGVSIVSVIATLAGWLPNIAALFSIIWLSMQMYDWVKKHRDQPR